MKSALFVALVMAVMSAGCARTVYRADVDGNAPSPSLGNDREVAYTVESALYSDPPECVTVLPMERAMPRHMAQMLEDAAARALSGRVRRVVGVAERERAVRRLAVDLAVLGDRQVFAAQTRCQHFAKVTTDNIVETYLVVWSDRRVSLAMSLIRNGEDMALWHARHTASRGDGGLPLSPVSLAVNAVEAGSFHGDGDVLPSIIDDALRRMTATLPDFR